VMDGLIAIRSIMLSNHIVRARLPEDVVASYHPGARGRGRDNATTPKVEEKDI
jgi:hypothetical protein